MRVSLCDRLDQVYSFRYYWCKVIFCSSVVKTPSNNTAADSARTGLAICCGAADSSLVNACGQPLFHCSSVKLFHWKIWLKSHLSLSEALRMVSWWSCLAAALYVSTDVYRLCKCKHILWFNKVLHWVSSPHFLKLSQEGIILFYKKLNMQSTGL